MARPISSQPMEANITVSVLLNTSIPDDGLRRDRHCEGYRCRYGHHHRHDSAVSSGRACGCVGRERLRQCGQQHQEPDADWFGGGRATVTVYDDLTKLGCRDRRRKNRSVELHKLGVLSDGSHSRQRRRGTLQAIPAIRVRSLVFTVDTLPLRQDHERRLNQRGGIAIGGRVPTPRSLTPSRSTTARFLGSTVSSGGVWSFRTTVNSTSAHVLRWSRPTRPAIPDQQQCPDHRQHEGRQTCRIVGRRLHHRQWRWRYNHGRARR